MLAMIEVAGRRGDWKTTARTATTSAAMASTVTKTAIQGKEKKDGADDDLKRRKKMKMEMVTTQKRAR